MEEANSFEEELEIALQALRLSRQSGNAKLRNSSRFIILLLGFYNVLFKKDWFTKTLTRANRRFLRLQCRLQARLWNLRNLTRSA